jgi:hypothetical protein
LGLFTGVIYVRFRLLSQSLNDWKVANLRFNLGMGALLDKLPWGYIF